MAKKQIYVGLEVKRKGKGFFIDCATIRESASRKEAATVLREYASMNPVAVLTESEANEMLERLKFLLAAKKFGKKQEKQLLQKLKEGRNLQAKVQ